MKRGRVLSIFSLIFLLLVVSCKKDDTEPEIAQNRRLLDIMEEWYFWYDRMPEVSPGSYPSPYELLEELRYRPLDRWSYITTVEEFLSYYRDSEFIGYGFGSAFDNQGRLRVSFVFNSVEMYDKGVRRGWIIDRVNGVKVTDRTNINQVLGPDQAGVSNSFTFIDTNGSIVEMTLSKQKVFMNTVLHTEIIEAAGKKIGYLVLQGFTAPSQDAVKDALLQFAVAGIDDLILDLRYNGGGQTDVASYLASVIGGPELNGNIFTRYIYNANKSEEENFTDRFKFPEGHPGLGLDRLIVISTGGTASASEMVINGLKPHMPVIVVGDDTYGKPMGMNVWFYADYAYVPITFMIANSDGFFDYFDGLKADSYVNDDLTRPFGDPEEAMLNQAIGFIETGAFGKKAYTKSRIVQPYEQMRGIRAEIGAH